MGDHCADLARQEYEPIKAVRYRFTRRADLAMPSVHDGNDEAWKAWKAIEPASHPFHSSWKSLRDYHIPTASTTGIDISKQLQKLQIRWSL